MIGVDETRIEAWGAHIGADAARIGGGGESYRARVSEIGVAVSESESALLESEFALLVSEASNSGRVRAARSLVRSSGLGLLADERTA
jgi:hypothetical protein